MSRRLTTCVSLSQITLKQIECMEIILRRIVKKGDVIGGILLSEGEPMCNTLEEASTALSPGVYPIERVYCASQRRLVPLIRTGRRLPCAHCPKCARDGLNVRLPNYCPQLRPGNGAYRRRDGTILVGQCAEVNGHPLHGFLLHPKSTFSRLNDRLRKAFNRGQGCWLRVEE